MCFGGSQPAVQPPPRAILAPIGTQAPVKPERGATKRVAGKKRPRRRGTGRSDLVISRPTGVNTGSGGVGIYNS